MMCNRNWKRFLLISLSGSLMAAGCTLELRDAVFGGLMDFVSGTTTTVLESLLPVGSGLGATNDGASAARSENHP